MFGTTARRASWALLTALLAFLVGVAPAARAGEWSDDGIKNILKDTKDAAKNTADISDQVDGLGDVVGIVQENLASLSGDMRDLLEEVPDTIKRIRAEQTEGIDAFLGGNDCGAGSPCDQFKHNIANFITELQSMVNELSGLDPSSPLRLQIDLGRFSSPLLVAPGRLLFPLYLAVTSNIDLFDHDLSSYFAEVRKNLAVVKMAFPSSTGVSGLAGSRALDISDRCPLLMGKLTPEVTPEIFSVAVSGVKGLGIALKVVGAYYLRASGYKSVNFRAGIDGWPQVDFDSNEDTQLGTIIDGFGDSALMLANHAGKVLRYCTISDSQAELLEAIGANLPPGRRNGKGVSR
jgi:hypothetical protein